MTDSPKKNSKRTRGYVMAGVGFLMILVNTLDYLLGWDGEFVPLMIIGLVFVVSGMNLARNR
jgi:hypothetical protein